MTSADASVTGKFHCGTTAAQGTSFAAPLAAGAAVLVRQWIMGGHYEASFVPSGERSFSTLLTPLCAHGDTVLTFSV